MELVFQIVLALCICGSALAETPCVIVKRMGPADEITSHLYSFGLRGKQFQYVEGEFPKGIKFHGRLTDHDIRNIMEKGGKVRIVEPKYTPEILKETRQSCKDDSVPPPAPQPTPEKR